MAVVALAVALTALLSNLSWMTGNRGHTGQQCPAIWSNSCGAALELLTRLCPAAAWKAWSQYLPWAERARRAAKPSIQARVYGCETETEPKERTCPTYH